MPDAVDAVIPVTPDDAMRIAQRLGRAIQFPTISYQDETLSAMSSPAFNASERVAIADHLRMISFYRRLLTDTTP